MRSILDIFGKSPFGPLQDHMAKISECVEKIEPLFDAVYKEDQEAVEEIAREISKLEYEADQIKNEVRDHLPKSIFMPVNRSDLLGVLSSQDTICDTAEDVAVLLTLRKMTMPESIKEDFRKLLESVMKTFRLAVQMINELDNLVEASFGGPEAEKVMNMINQIGELEHRTDKIEKGVIKGFFKIEDQLKPVALFWWLRILKNVGNIANSSEKMGNRLRLVISKM